MLSASRRPAHILIVEDDPASLGQIVEILQQNEHECLLAKSWAETQALLDNPIEIVILDLNLPDATGLDIFERIRLEEHLVDVPVIVLTGSDSRKDVLVMFEAGVLDYMIKPVMPLVLTSKVNILLALQRQRKELQDLSVLDPLTGIFNRRYFERQLENEWFRAMRGNKPISLLVIDLDKFKAINDSFGHAAGDRALVRVANTLGHHLRRRSDVIARYGGDEFVALLPDADIETAATIAEDICSSVNDDRPVTADESDSGLPLSLTIGVACMVPTEESTPDSLFELADGLLMAAKRNNDRGGVKIELQDKPATGVRAF